jgi:hypothetical protein
MELAQMLADIEREFVEAAQHLFASPIVPRVPSFSP